MNKPQVSIITPLYNGERYIAEAIESALKQTFDDFELLIVNDGSTDSSREIVEHYLDDPRVRYFEKENGGVASARNFALQKAKGEWIGFLDQDDMWLPHKLEQQIDYINKNPEISLLHSPQIYVDSDGCTIHHYPKDFVKKISGFCFKELFEGNKIAVLSVLVKKESLDQIGGFSVENSRADDYQVWLEISYCSQLGFTEDALVKYRVHDSNESHNHLKMELAELGVINHFLNKYPAAKKSIGNHLINKRLYFLHTEIAQSYLWNNFDYDNAHEHFFLAWRNKIFCIKTIRLLLWTGLSSQQRKRITWYKKKIFG